MIRNKTIDLYMITYQFGPKVQKAGQTPVPTYREISASATEIVQSTYWYVSNVQYKQA